MEGFSDIESSSSDVGSEVSEVESRDTDFGNGDGVNDFDEIYNDMNSGNETIEYGKQMDDTVETATTGEEDFGTTDSAVDSELDDFDDSDVANDVSEAQSSGNDIIEETDQYDMTTDESVDAALSDFDDSEYIASETETASDEVSDEVSDETAEVADETTEISGEEMSAETKVDNSGEDFDSEKSHIDRSEMIEGVKDITRQYYSDAKDVAEQSADNGRYYTDHKEAHVEMVADKSIEAGEAIKDAMSNGGLKGENTEDRVAFSSNIDQNTLEGAALSHDTGMRGDGYALEEKNADGVYGVHKEDNSNFDEVRTNHSLNSALNVLENREQYKDIGYTDEQVDKMAAECMAHSKSSSGVKDLGSREQWSDCFDRIDAAVDAYNADHPDYKISFDRDLFENDDEKLGELASETLALRVGDVSRDSFAGAEAQAGENVYVDRETINNHGGSVEKELENANITIGENSDTVDNLKSRQVHTGEQNIVENHTYANLDGQIVHEVTIDDGATAPMCTQEALKDHIGELATAKDGDFEMDVKFNSPCDEFAQQKYNSFRDQIEADDKYSNIQISYPWDRR